MAAKPDRCSQCSDTVTHLVRTTGGVHRTCEAHADELADTLADRLVAVFTLPTSGLAPVAKAKATQPVWDEAAEKLPDNVFAKQITGLLAEVKDAA